jgi:hypothetical protein
MSDSDDERHLFQPGYVTPPLSPSKTVSTEGWFSPRTPESPRKAYTCHVKHQSESIARSFYLTPPASPTKSKSTLNLGALTDPVFSPATSDTITPQAENDSTDEQRVTAHLLLSLPTLTPEHTPSTPATSEHSRAATGLSADDALAADTWLASPRKAFHRSFSDSLTTPSTTGPVLSPCNPDTIGLVAITPTKARSVYPSSGESYSPLPTPCRLSSRSASSPLRSSQWALRGGLLPSPRRGQTCTPDRFIASRRPLYVTRESFELNKPSERLETTRIGHSSRPSADPFSRRLRRSGRLNDELRGLREAHSLLVGRTSAHRRITNLTYRRSSATSGTRQISAGAVWNVGGPSAVSDTIFGVSNGRGGMLGAGTNAPLYTSRFLNRADPEAELEAYERRLALAFDVDQTDRVLQHSASDSIAHSAGSPGALHTKHRWRDGAWIRDGNTACLSSFFPVQANGTPLIPHPSAPDFTTDTSKTRPDIAVQIRYRILLTM